MMQLLIVNWLYVVVGLIGALCGALGVFFHCARWVKCYRILWENERNGNTSARQRLTLLEDERMDVEE